MNAMILEDHVQLFLDTAIGKSMDVNLSQDKQSEVDARCFVYANQGGQIFYLVYTTAPDSSTHLSRSARRDIIGMRDLDESSKLAKEKLSLKNRLRSGWRTFRTVRSANGAI